MSDDRLIDDPKLRKLEALIRKSFRVRDNRTPVYVDVAGHLDRIGLDQHQIVFGRRGSGKSCLLIYFRREVASKHKVHSIYILGDTIKTLEYPDVLIRLLLAIFDGLPGPGPYKRVWLTLRRSKSERKAVVHELRALLALPSESKLRVTTGASESKSSGSSVGVNKTVEASLTEESAETSSREEIRESHDRKIRTVDARLSDYKRVIQDEMERSSREYGVFIIDDFYLIDPADQPDVIDYLHRLLRDTDLYLKVGTVQHRTQLLRTSPIHVGVQVGQDVDGFSLDQTLEDIEQTGAYLEEMLRKLGEQVDVHDAPALMSDQGRKDIILLAGGVPRD